MNDSKREKIYLKTSIVINLAITIFTITASIIMFTGFKFMHGYDVVLEATRFRMFKFFTVKSNIFMGVVALIFSIKEIKLLNGKISEIPTKLYILKLMSTTAVALTFLVVFTYLGPISENGIPSMLMNGNLFFHLIIPLLSIISFIFLDKTEKLNFKQSFYGIIPTALYAIYYLGNVILHMENGKVFPIYDWYWFVQNGVWTGFIVGPIILLITYVISLILWKMNKKIGE